MPGLPPWPPLEVSCEAPHPASGRPLPGERGKACGARRTSGHHRPAPAEMVGVTHGRFEPTR